MVWLILGIIVAAFIIASAINASNKKNAQLTFDKAQIDAAATRSTTVKVGDSAVQWSIAPNKMTHAEQRFLLSSDNGSSNMISVKSHLNGSALYINDVQVAKGSLTGISDEFPFSIDVDGARFNGIIKSKQSLSECRTSVYIENQFIGEFFSKG